MKIKRHIYEIFLNLCYFMNPWFLFESKNHRRYCKLCGQQQDLFGRSLYSKYNWWEDRGEIFNSDCICHKH